MYTFIFATDIRRNVGTNTLQTQILQSLFFSTTVLSLAVPSQALINTEVCPGREFQTRHPPTQFSYTAPFLILFKR